MSLAEHHVAPCTVKAPTLNSHHIQVATSAALSFWWVQSYQYQYNVDLLNTQGVNVWAFSLWTLSGYVFLRTLEALAGTIRHSGLRLATGWAAYGIGLLFFEYLGYYILQIREVHAQPADALVWGLVHGSNALHLYYIFFPVLIWGLHRLAMHLSARVQRVSFRAPAAACGKQT